MPNTDSATVSVVIPLYNAEKSIWNTLSSVKDQEYQPIETIVVNDGSTDTSAQVVERFIAEHQHLNIQLVNKPNGGVSTARNEGMKRARGKYIALLDSDDFWYPAKLKAQVAVLEENADIDLLGCIKNNEVVDRFFFKKFSRLTRLSSRLLLYKNFISPPTVMLRRKLLDTVGYFDETQRHSEEVNYWIRICDKNKCVLLNEALITAGAGKPAFGFSGLSSNLKEMEKGELKNIGDALRLKIIGIPEYCFLYVYSLVKYFRRVAIVKLRK